MPGRVLYEDFAHQKRKKEEYRAALAEAEKRIAELEALLRDADTLLFNSERRTRWGPCGGGGPCHQPPRLTPKAYKEKAERIRQRIAELEDKQVDLVGEVEHLGRRNAKLEEALRKVAALKREPKPGAADQHLLPVEVRNQIAEHLEGE